MCCSTADSSQLYAVCHTNSDGSRILLFRCKVPPSIRDVVDTLGLNVRSDQGDTIAIDLLSRHEIANAPLVIPGSGLHLTSSGEIAA